MTRPLTLHMMQPYVMQHKPGHRSFISPIAGTRPSMRRVRDDGQMVLALEGPTQ